MRTVFLPLFLAIQYSLPLVTAPRLHAQGWAASGSPVTNWSCIACSADGQIVLAGVEDGLFGFGGLYVSTNHSAGWALTTAPIGIWWSAACSADGSTLVAANAAEDGNGGIYISKNRSADWARANVPDLTWLAVAASGDAADLLAGGYHGALYTSRDGGTSWSSRLTNGVFRGAASSAGGQVLMAASEDGRLFISTNDGSAWATSSWPRLDAVACTATGNAIAAADYEFGISLSTNTGTTWTGTNIANVWCVAASADGSSFVAGDWSGAIHVSRDSGSSWSEARPAGSGITWWGVASSADGCRLYAAAHGGQIWTLQTTPSPTLNISQTGTNLLLSWLVPSMEFALQESPDVTTTNWTEVLAPRSLNYTNIHYEVTVPSSAERRFYRLISVNE